MKSSAFSVCRVDDSGILARAVCALGLGVLLVGPGLAQAQSPTNPSALPAIPPTPVPGLTYAEDFFPKAAHDASVPTPDSVLGFQSGSKPASHAQVEAVFKAIAAKSPRVKLFEYGRTHEGRALWYAVVATPERIKTLDALKGDLARLADPRMCTPGEADELVKRTPLVAWMAYVIHGDEMSGTDASLALLYHLAAGTGEDVKDLLENLVVIIDPLMNPDGRDRFISMINQNRTVQAQVDDQSLLHTGFWPFGRMNHYLFDMNRDWIFATQPETRGRIEAIRDWHPHFLTEGHEQEPLDTFLFMPARAPFNPNYPRHVDKWVNALAQDQARAFDGRAWRYYTGEWNEEWYPGYSSSWAALRGSVENLYEQARIQSDAVRRPEGTLEAYREAVHKQLVSSMANLESLARNRGAVLTDFVADRRAVLADGSPYAGRTFAILPGANASRSARLMDLLRIQGFEASLAGSAFSADATDRLGRVHAGRAFPKGTVLVPTRQPLARLLAAMFDFDPRMTPEFLAVERRELLRFNRSKLYDITGWSLPMLFDVECFTLGSEPPPEARATRVVPTAPTPPAPSAPPAEAAAFTALVVDGADDRSVAHAARLLERGVQVRIADRPFAFDARPFARGSVVVTRKDNQDFTASLARVVFEVAGEMGLSPVVVGSGLGAGDLPDIGGEHFVLLHRPRIAIVGRDPTNPYSFGAAWYTLDHELGVRATYIDFANLSASDLRRYNVLVLPDGPREQLADKMGAIKAWVEGGGTLVAIASAAAAVANEKGIGTVRQVDDVVTKPEPYIQAVIRDFQALTEKPDPARVYAGAVGSGENTVEFPWDGALGDEKPSDDELKRRDAWRKIFMPQGVILAARADDRSWLTMGVSSIAGTFDNEESVRRATSSGGLDQDSGLSLPVLYGGGTTLVSAPGVSAPVRFGVFSPAPPKPEEKKPVLAKGSDKPEKADGATDAKRPDTKDEKKEEKKPKPGWSIAPAGMELRLRMCGLLWPEAAERLANTAAVTREQVGAGQVILFAAEPNFRAATLATSRVFANACVYGPGMGASQPVRP